MKYYLVVNEWNYPNESGRDFIGDYDTLIEAAEACFYEYLKEENNFLEANDGEIYEEGCGPIKDKKLNCTGYVINSSSNESENHFFRSIIIERIV